MKASESFAIRSTGQGIWRRFRGGDVCRKKRSKWAGMGLVFGGHRAAGKLAIRQGRMSVLRITNRDCPDEGPQNKGGSRCWIVPPTRPYFGPF